MICDASVLAAALSTNSMLAALKLVFFLFVLFVCLFVCLFIKINIACSLQSL